MTTTRTLIGSLATPLLGAGLLLPSVALADRVSKVVVYPDRAQVTRLTQVACDDKVLARFAAIPPAADAQSVRAHVDLASAQVLGVRTEVEVLSTAFAKQFEELDEAIRRIDVELQLISDQRSRDRAVEAVATRYEDVALALLGRELVDPPGNPATPAQLPKAWTAVVEAPLMLRLDRHAATTACRRRVESCGNRREELNGETPARLPQLAAGKRAAYRRGTGGLSGWCQGSQSPGRADLPSGRGWIFDRARGASWRPWHCGAHQLRNPPSAYRRGLA